MKDYISNIYNKNFKFKVFNKLLILYSAVVILSLVALTFFMCNSIITSTRNSELNTNKKIVNSVNVFLSNKNINTANIIYQLYSSQEILNDMTSYLENNIEDYTSKLLDRYSESASFDINTTETFIRYNFNTYPDIESVSLYSSVQNMYSTYNSNNKFSFYSGNRVDNQNIANENIMIGQNYTNPVNKNVKNFNLPYTITHIIKDSETKKVLGNISISYSSEKIENSYSQYKDELLGYILILSPNGNVIYDSSKKHTGIYPYLNLLKNDVTSVNLETKCYVNVDSTNPNAIIVGIIPEKEVLNKSMLQVRTVISIALILILLAIFFIFFFLNSYSKRTENIMKAMDQLKHGDLSANIPIISKQEDELSVISQSFNDMSRNLNAYIKKVYLLELKQKMRNL